VLKRLHKISSMSIKYLILNPKGFSQLVVVSCCG